MSISRKTTIEDYSNEYKIMTSNINNAIYSIHDDICNTIIRLKLDYKQANALKNQKLCNYINYKYQHILKIYEVIYGVKFDFHKIKKL